jgi:hypothetical protein
MNTTTQELGADRWAEYFDSLVPSIEGSLVTIEIMSDELGDQVDVERLPLQAIGYDRNDNALEISVGGGGGYPVLLQHFIFGPQTIGIEGSSETSPSAILVTDGGGVRTLIRLFKPTTS